MERKISLCMIAKNEEAVLESCLQSVSHLVQEMVLVDTGSTDSTVEVGRRHGMRVFSFPWESDFSAARNYSIGQARLPWILVVDADEVLSSANPTQLKAFLSDLPITGTPPSAYSLIQRNYVKGSGKMTWNRSWQPNPQKNGKAQEHSGYLDVPVVRLFPRRPDILYSGCVHEGVEPSLAESGYPVKTSGLILHHYGQVRRKDEKQQLYLRLGLKKVRQDPQDARAHFELAIQYQELERYGEAIPHYRLAQALNEELPRVDFYLAYCFQRTGNRAAAAAYFQRARSSCADSPELWCELALQQLGCGRLQEACQHFETALSIHPGHVRSLCYLGAARVGQGKTAEGIAHLKQAIALDGQHGDSWINLGRALEKCGKLEDAVRLWEEAHARFPDDDQFAEALALALGRCGRPKEAAGLLEDLVKRNPGSSQLQMLRAGCLALCGKADQALRVYRDVYRTGGRFRRLASEKMSQLSGLTAPRRSSGPGQRSATRTDKTKTKEEEPHASTRG